MIAGLITKVGSLMQGGWITLTAIEVNRCCERFTFFTIMMKLLLIKLKKLGGSLDCQRLTVHFDPIQRISFWITNFPLETLFNLPKNSINRAFLLFIIQEFRDALF